MKKIIFIFVMILQSIPCFAENSQILKCRVENSEWRALFLLDAVGAGFLKFKRIGQERNYTCGLKLEYINDGQRNVVPEITVEFTRGSCDPELGTLDQEILKSLTLFVNLNNKEKPVGRVQWLKRRQPESCVVEKISMFDIQMNAKKWVEGKWGRSTASDPKKAPKEKVKSGKTGGGYRKK